MLECGPGVRVWLGCGSVVVRVWPWCEGVWCVRVCKGVWCVRVWPWCVRVRPGV